MSELIPPPAWTTDAVCAQVDAEAFYPEKGSSVAPAKRVCNGDPGRGVRPCPVRAACLAWALDTNQLWGIWGGKSAQERRKIRAERAEEVPDAA